MEYIEEHISFVETTMNDLFNAQSRRGSEPVYNEYYPLHAAVERGEFSKVEKELQKKDMIIDEKDWFCCTPLTYAVIKCLHHAVLSKKGRFVEYNNSLKIVKALRDSGAMPEKMTLPMSVDEDHLYTWDGVDCEDEGRLGHQDDIYELVKDVHAKLKDIDDSQVKEKILELYTSLHARRTVPAANVMVAKAAKPRVGPGPAAGPRVKKKDPWEN